MLNQESNCPVDPVVLDEMVVIKYEEEGARAGCDIVDHFCNYSLSLW